MLLQVTRMQGEMISFFFSVVFFALGYWMRGTKAAVWLNKVFSKSEA